LCTIEHNANKVLCFFILWRLIIPYQSLKNINPSWKKLDGVALTLSQANWIADHYDRLKPAEDKGEI